ncbi:MAG TPA: PilZ domain-containing protein, partial [Anaeromyxobacteraceae bacterium]
AARPPSPAPPPPAALADVAPPRPPPRPNVDLMALIDEELVDEPRHRPRVTRVEVNVSLVSEHNFYVGPTRRVDSGGVFISTMLPPPVGTHLQVKLGLADGRKLELEGEVAFLREKNAISGRQPAGCGVKLHNLPGWAVDAIDRFLLARPPIVYAA